MNMLKFNNILELNNYKESVEGTIAEVVTQRDNNGNVVKKECFIFNNNKWNKIDILNG